MNLKRIARAVLLSIGLGFAATSYSSVAEKDRPQRVSYNGSEYRAERCSFVSKGADGWCISDSESNYVTNKKLYEKLAFRAEVQRDSTYLHPTIEQSIEAFDKASDIQAIVKTAKFVNDAASDIEASLLLRMRSGALLESKEDQYQIVKDIFKDQQKQVYSMYTDKLKEKFGEDFSQRLLNREVSEKEIKDILKEITDESYGYQLRVASSELRRADKLISKKNKTQEDYNLLWNLMSDGIARGYMAAKAINVINETNTLENSAKSIAYKLGKGVGLDYVFDLGFLVENPDMERAIKESEKEFLKFKNKFDEFSKAYDVKNPDSSASKIFEVQLERGAKNKPKEKTNLPIKVEKPKEIVKPIENKPVKIAEKPKIPQKPSKIELTEFKVFYEDLDCDGTKEKIETDMGNIPGFTYTIAINENYSQPNSCSKFSLEKNSDNCGYFVVGTEDPANNRGNNICSIKHKYKWNGNKLVLKQSPKNISNINKITLYAGCNDSYLEVTEDHKSIARIIELNHRDLDEITNPKNNNNKDLNKYFNICQNNNDTMWYRIMVDYKDGSSFDSSVIEKAVSVDDIIKNLKKLEK